MKPTFVDIHIHTSENPKSLPSNYDVKELIKNVRELSGDYDVLLSLSDHNTINKSAYMSLIKEDVNVLIGVELHVKKYDNAPPYHCHIVFNEYVTKEGIDEINAILDYLYPNKIVTDEDTAIPNIESIINAFDSYEFLLLPHGGQSHRTFNKATSKSTRFDTSMEKSIYHNHFDGFTSRSSTGLESTKKYFEEIGISEFVNLITCTDNYRPCIYPKTKSKEAEDFTPTWMLAEPTFEGLRISLSEESRLHYSVTPPQKWTSTLGQITLKNEKIDIDVNMTPGLNVVIGGSSSGKTLFVDSLVNGINKSFEESNYKDFLVKDIEIENPSSVSPYYISQNFIMSVIRDSENDLSEIPVIDKVFPEDKDTLDSIRHSLEKLKRLINQLVDCAEKLEKLRENFSHIKEPNYLVSDEAIRSNIIETLNSTQEDEDKLFVSESDYNEYRETLIELQKLFSEHPIAENKNMEIKVLLNSLDSLMLISQISEITSSKVKEIIGELKKKSLEKDRKLVQIKEDRDNLVRFTYDAIKSLIDFYNAKEELSKFDVEFETNEIIVAGHTLSIKNSFKLTEGQLLDSINTCLIKNYRVDSFNELKPDNLQKKCFSKSPKIKSHSELANRVYKLINDTNKKEYQITTVEGKDYKSLSPGWKSAVILDLILGYENNSAPIIIDQPEDNLATGYINGNLIEIIKKIKEDKQVILVSHNATIPILGDAQNIIICENDGEKVIIRSAILESEINGKKTLDLIAELTDGGKPSIKKRVKKYNFRNYREDTR
ncbi:MAG: hypothetical protein ACTJGH_03025 [Peptoniphilaceae bacterium]